MAYCNMSSKVVALRVNLETKFCLNFTFCVIFFILRRNKGIAFYFLESTWDEFAWKPQYTTGEEWLQLDLNQVKKIKAIATKGLSLNGTSSYCQSYTVSYSKSGAVWQEYKENDVIKVRKVGLQFVYTKSQHYAKVTSEVFYPLQIQYM